MLRGVGQRPVLAVLVGAVAIAFSGILFRLTHVSPSTGAFYRCVWALPPLWLLSRVEDRRYGKRDRRSVRLAARAAPGEPRSAPAGRPALHRDVRVGARVRRDRRGGRRSGSDAVLVGDRLADPARVLVAGVGLAADLDVAAAAAGRRHLDP